jgi:site-specific DNA-methyltransferase (adenine-specific)
MPEETSEDMQAQPEQEPRRRGTSTSSFGVGRRESHDSSGFYARFGDLPELSTDETVNRLEKVDRIVHGDARKMDEIESSSVALVVTSPPYFVGKEYEEALGVGHVPATYVDYLKDLEEVFAECYRVLEPGGRIAVNVANLGRKPYRSLSADVIGILQDRLGFFLRGEIIWQKGRGAAGSCAWGSFESAQNPVLRDISERVVVASKGRFDRALGRPVRRKRKLPFQNTIEREEFMEATLDVWEFPAESAKRVGHPAPFPIELPKRLIELYTFRDDVVLDPFMGSGSTALAAIRTDRRYVGYEIDAEYVRLAERRIDEELEDRKQRALARRRRKGIFPVDAAGADKAESFQAASSKQGRRVKEIAHELLEHLDFRVKVQDHRGPGGVVVNFIAVDQEGRTWYFDVSGAFTRSRPGLRRTDTLWKALGRAAVLQEANLGTYRLVLLSTDLPPRGSAGGMALKELRGKMFHDAIEMRSQEGQDRLRRYAHGEGYEHPLGDILFPDE